MKKMRLGQLARKLDIKPTQIVSFLKKTHSIIIDESLNSKIEDNVFELVMTKFQVIKPIKVIERALKTNSISEQILVEEINSTEEVETEVDIDKVIETITEEVANEIFEDEAIDEAVDNIVDDELKMTQAEDDAIDEALDNIVTDELQITPSEIEELKDPESIEIVKTESLTAYDEDGEPIELTVIDGVIKAPKKELEGFKVIGKIDLPQKAKPIQFIITNNGKSTDITETIEKTRIELTEHKRLKYLARVEKRKLAAKSKPSKSRRTLSELDIREKANKLAVEKQIQHTKTKKEQQKKHYEQNKKIAQKSNKKKKNNPKKGDLQDMKSYDKEPSTKWGRIWKWFNT
jgi:hypothetical protein